MPQNFKSLIQKMINKQFLTYEDLAFGRNLTDEAIVLHILDNPQGKFNFDDIIAKMEDRELANELSKVYLTTILLK